MPTVSFASNTSGNTELVAAPGAGKSIQLLGFTLSAAGTVVASLQDSEGTPLNLTRHALINGSQAVAPPSAEWQWVCGANTALRLNLSGAVFTYGSVTYRVVGE